MDYNRALITVLHLPSRSDGMLLQPLSRYFTLHTRNPEARSRNMACVRMLMVGKFPVAVIQSPVPDCYLVTE
jgi:hypothetical protein